MGTRAGRLLLLIVLTAGTTVPAAAQSATDHRWLALGFTSSVTSGHSIRDAETDALLGDVGSQFGIGFDIRGQIHRRILIAIWGDYHFPTGPLREGGGGGTEADFLLNTRGAAQVYLGAVAGADYARYEGIGGTQQFQGTRLAVGPVAGLLLRLGHVMRLGLDAEYLLGSSPYISSYKDGSPGEPPKIATPGTLVIRSRILFTAVQ